MQNFDYLKDITELRDLYSYCAAAEATQKTDHDACALNCRRALEWMVRTIYTLKHLRIPERANLLELMSGEPFIQFIDDDRLLMAAHYIRKVGNLSAHAGGVKGGQAYFSLLNLYNFIGGVLLKLGVLEFLAPFDRTLIPDVPPLHKVPSAKIEPAPVKFLTSIPEEKLQKPVPAELPASEYTEEQTRKLFIDLMLEEAGWKVLEKKHAIVPGKACIETKVTGMPSESGDGYVDYVLFGDDGRPLALVEAKKTSVSIEAGRQQAKLYADCLENEYGIRPVIYLSNGFHTEIIDGLGYPSRDIYGFHTQADLVQLIAKRGRGGITDVKVREDITDRYYQKEAIHAVCHHFNNMHRRALVVMATGTGKTRVSISLTELLMRNGWARNILFLADRKALVKQAHRSFTRFLGNSVPMTILNEHKRIDHSARITFSTYQTMIRYIDAKEKPFSVGAFDLVIVDEAHRSIFGKYEAILDYYDSLIVGLTATPKESVDKSTFDVFGLEDGHPNYDYPLSKATREKNLVPPRWISCSTDFLKKGIKFNDLSEENKAQLDRVWDYEEIDPGRDIESDELLSYIFNEDTIDKVLRHLMERGHKVQGGEQIGKTIIFAHNHDHATNIVKRFHALYPHLGDDFCALIDDKVKYAQSLIDRFSAADKLPQIAVSVDMMDTGIDVPEVQNLVFFKRIRSKIKFWQMVGRGTRKCENVSGDGVDKKDFLVFDWCGNIEYFSEMPSKEPEQQQSLSSRIFKVRTSLVAALQEPEQKEKPGAEEIAENIKKTLVSQVKAIDNHKIGIRKNWEFVNRFCQEESWDHISLLDESDLHNFVAPHVDTQTRGYTALKWDILIYKQMLSRAREDAPPSLLAERKMCSIAKALLHKLNIPQVAAKRQLLEEISHQENLHNANLERLEYIRTELGDIVRYLGNDSQQIFILNIEDVLNESTEVEGPEVPVSYEQRIMDWLQENRELPVIQKLKNLEQLDHADIIQLETICWRDLGTREEYQEYIHRCGNLYGESVAAFIRSVTGIDQLIAIQRYSEFLSDIALNPAQEQYLRAIISYVSTNGDIEFRTLVTVPPFRGVDWTTTFGPAFNGFTSFVDNLHQVIVA